MLLVWRWGAADVADGRWEMSGPCMLHGRMECGDCFNLDLDEQDQCLQCGLWHLDGFCRCNCLLNTNADCPVHSIGGAR